MIEVILCDDHALIRRGIRDTLADAPDMRVVGEAADYTELRGLMRGEACDVLVLDINLPGRSGLDVLHALKDEGSPVKVLVVSMYPEDQYAIRVLKAGAAGYLSKDSASDELVKAIHRVLLGKKYISQTIAEKLATSFSGDTAKPPQEYLSDREFEVMKLLASGKTISEIAEMLSLSVTTVSTYRARVMTKMNMKTNADLTKYALENKLL